MDEPWPADLTAAEAHALAAWPRWLAVEAAELGLLELVARGCLAVWAEERPRRLRRTPALVPLGVLLAPAPAEAPWPLRSLSDALAAVEPETQPTDVRAVRLARVGDALRPAGHGHARDWGRGLLRSLAGRGLVEDGRRGHGTGLRLTEAGAGLHEALAALRHDARSTVLGGRPFQARTPVSLVALGPVREALAAWQPREPELGIADVLELDGIDVRPLPVALGCIRAGLQHAGFANVAAGPDGGRFDPAPDAVGG